ncbi:hypothetical protein PVAND_009974 [Polypedilum vanderplanki]|uniref:CRAL-TRIO domain-containing protein n=1 Tax=Polypedilum vanderplanki TaxID=319348 RepID=A0A9J6CED6_POLVA|nr:hypothetical protein PVAND_009974 [Polypedilum vanderplanki]
MIEDENDDFEDCLDEQNIEETPNYLEEFRAWVKDSKKLPKTISDAFLMRFLKVCDNDLTKAQELLMFNFKLRSSAPNLFTNRDIKAKEIQTAADIMHFFALEKRTKDNFKVSVATFHNTDASIFNYTDLLKTALMILDTRFAEYDYDNKIADGDIMISDMQGMSFRHFLKMMRAFSTATFYMKYLQESAPIKIVQAHLVNPSGVVNRMFSIMRPFMKKELLDVFHIHSNGYESLYDYVPKELLPSEYGGTSGVTIEESHRQWIARTEKNRDFLLNDDNWRFQE